jgi:hypothetical protein
MTSLKEKENINIKMAGYSRAIFRQVREKEKASSSTLTAGFLKGLTDRT